MSVSDLTSSAELVMLSAGKHFPVKLTKTNFLVWRRQVQSTLVGIDLLGFVDGTITAPAKFLDPACTKPNPAYTHWYRQDQILLGALLGSCSDAVQPLIFLVDTSHDAWSRLNTHLASMSRGRIISLKAQLNKNPRGNRSIEAYISDMTTIAGDLALAGSPVAEEDLVVSIMTQLGDDYQAIYQSLRGRGDVTLYELSHILTDCERQLPAREAMGEFSHIPTANFVRQGPVGTGGRGSGHGGRHGRGGRQGFPGHVHPRLGVVLAAGSAISVIFRGMTLGFVVSCKNSYVIIIVLFRFRRTFTYGQCGRVISCLGPSVAT